MTLGRVGEVAEAMLGAFCRRIFFPQHRYPNRFSGGYEMMLSNSPPTLRVNSLVIAVEASL